MHTITMHAKEGLEVFKTSLLPKGQATILDIGCGKAQPHAKELRKLYHWQVETCDFFDHATYTGDYNKIDMPHQFDGIWCSHTLEHQLNINSFLRKINADLKEGGVLGITVPPRKDKIVGGHVSIWNPGLLLYNLVMAGINCKHAKVAWYGYNITCIIPNKESIELPKINYDNGDITKLAEFFPFLAREGFDGCIKSINWPNYSNLPKPRFFKPLLQG